MDDDDTKSPTRRRLKKLFQHITSGISLQTSEYNKTAQLFFFHNPSQVKYAWSSFCSLPSWRDRASVATFLRRFPKANKNFLNCYREKLEPFILPSFYNLLENPLEMKRYRQQYETTGEINIPILKSTCLHKLKNYCDKIEHKGKRRYGEKRPSYPPGEWATWSNNDPRKCIQTDVNMTAVASRHLTGTDDDILWIYHSPHLQLFIEKALGCNSLFPYLNDLGIAVNIMRPRPNTQTALGFHFDSVDSSIKKVQHDIQQSKGVTGVIGLVDAIEGGERIVFPHVHRENVKDVSQIVQNYNPLQPHQSLTLNAIPQVESKPTAGMLYLFDGGNVLHGVSSVRKGDRMALAFMYSELPPSESDEDEASANFFYQKN
jgi:hypothetical protein